MVPNQQDHRDTSGRKTLHTNRQPAQTTCTRGAFGSIFCCVSANLPELASSLASVAKGLHARGWLLGTSGNLSAVVQRDPLQLAMSPSGVDKGELTAQQVLTIDEHANVISDPGVKPSDESLLHICIVKQRGAGAVLHTHSVWNTMLSDCSAPQVVLTFEGYEMLKGLQGVSTHEHSEWLPIVKNSQDMHTLADTVRRHARRAQSSARLSVRRHGLYSWVKTWRRLNAISRFSTFCSRHSGEHCSLSTTEV